MEKMTLEEIREVTDWTNLNDYGAEWWDNLNILDELLNPKFYTHIKDIDSYISNTNMLGVQIAFVAPYEWKYGSIPADGAKEIGSLASLLSSIDTHHLTRDKNIHYEFQTCWGAQYAWRVFFYFGVPIKDEYKKKEQ